MEEEEAVIMIRVAVRSLVMIMQLNTRLFGRRCSFGLKCKGESLLSSSLLFFFAALGWSVLLMLLLLICLPPSLLEKRRGREKSINRSFKTTAIVSLSRSEKAAILQATWQQIQSTAALSYNILHCSILSSIIFIPFHLPPSLLTSKTNTLPLSLTLPSFLLWLIDCFLPSFLPSLLPYFLPL
jgi:hypothetical protein